MLNPKFLTGRHIRLNKSMILNGVHYDAGHEFTVLCCGELYVTLIPRDTIQYCTKLDDVIGEYE